MPKSLTTFSDNAHSLTLLINPFFDIFFKDGNVILTLADCNKIKPCSFLSSGHNAIPFSMAARGVIKIHGFSVKNNFTS